MTNMKKPLKIFAAAAMALLSLATARAQTPDESQTAALQARIDELTQRLEKQEKKSVRWEKLLANLPQISGYGIMGCGWSNTDDTWESSFNISSVRLILAGDIGSKIDYKFQFEFVSPKLIDAFLRYKICPQFSLQAGQFRTGFGLEGYMVPLEMEAADYAPIVKAICTQYCDTRDIGIAAYGSLIPVGKRHIFEYMAGVYNGEGKNKADTNHSKDVIARLKINPLDDLSLSGSFSYGERGETYVHNTRYAAGFWWHGERLFVRSEYLGMKQYDPAAGTKRSIEGCYAVAGYWIKKFCPLVRYNFMESDMDGSPVRRSDWLVGVDYKPLKYLRLQLNYTRTHYNGHGNGNMVGLTVTGAF